MASLPPPIRLYKMSNLRSKDYIFPATPPCIKSWTLLGLSPALLAGFPPAVNGSSSKKNWEPCQILTFPWTLSHSISWVSSPEGLFLLSLDPSVFAWTHTLLSPGSLLLSPPFSNLAFTAASRPSPMPRGPLSLSPLSMTNVLKMSVKLGLG